MADNILGSMAADSVKVFTIDWATAAEKKYIIERNKKEGRQTMNLTLMPTAQLFIIKDDGNVVGWTGFDVKHNPTYPEMFSLYLEPFYASIPDLGLALSHIKYTYLLQLGIKRAYGRVQANTNDDRLQFRINLGINELVDPKDHADWVAMCKQCSLFGKTCTKQSYFTVDLERLTKMAKLKLGGVSPSQFPVRLELCKGRYQTDSLFQSSDHQVRWAA